MASIRIPKGTFCLNMLGFLFESVPVSSLRNTQFRPKFFVCEPRRRYRASTPRAQAQVAANPVAQGKEGKAQNATVDKLLDAGLGVVVLKRGKANLFREQRNPMVFSGSIERHIPPRGRSLTDCDPVAVCNGTYACLGFGFFNSHSMFRVRILRHVEPEAEEAPPLPWNLEEDILVRMQNAVSLREAIGMPNSMTNIYRVINGEGDRLSGLIVDRIAETLVISSSALWCERYKDQIIGGLAKVLPSCADVIWRRNIDRLRQDGLIEEKKQEINKEDEAKVAVSDGHQDAPAEAVDSSVLVKECDVKYELSRFALTRGQKTGHYADQKENRMFIRDLVRQRTAPSRVLDLFCYTGGFAMNAILGSDEASVVAVDSSGRAIDMGRKNADLNGISDRVSFVQSDVMKYLRSSPEDYESFDMVIVDPPKFAPNVKALQRATHKYRSLNQAAMRMVKRGGLLCTCSCSAAMTQNRHLFIETIRTAAILLGREVTLLKTFGASSDHPITPEMPESEYLTMCVFLCR